MKFRPRTITALIAAFAGLASLVVPAGSAAAFDYKSTNEANRVENLPHVVEVSKGPGTVTLDFVNPTPFLWGFEYRIDGVEVATATPHRVLGEGEVEYPNVCVEGDEDFPGGCAPGPIRRTFSAEDSVEIRLALGAEPKWYFDWTEFTVGPTFSSQTEAPARHFPSGRAVASLYKGFHSTTGITKVLLQVPTSDYFTATGAAEATLSIKCDVRKQNGDVVKRIYRNSFTDSDTVRTINWGPNRPCERVRSVFIRAIPGNGITIQQAVDTLSNPSFPDNRPLRITIGSIS